MALEDGVSARAAGPGLSHIRAELHTAVAALLADPALIARWRAGRPLLKIPKRRSIDGPTPAAALYPRNGNPEGAHGRGCLELARSGARGARLHPDSRWRNRAEFLQGREAIEAFLRRKWDRELDYRLIKEIWAFRENRIAVRFAYEWHDDAGQWYRSYGNENWEFDAHGLMRTRIASINDAPIACRSASSSGPAAGARMIIPH